MPTRLGVWLVRTHSKSIFGDSGNRKNKIMLELRLLNDSDVSLVEEWLNREHAFRESLENLYICQSMSWFILKHYTTRASAQTDIFTYI